MKEGAPRLIGSQEWEVNPSTGVISLTREGLQTLLNTDPIENWYVVDPEPIARGQFAVVYHCHHRITGEEYAAKFSRRWRLGSECTSDLIHEIAVCAMLRPTSRAVQLMDVFSSEQELILVMEYAPGGDLQNLLDANLVPYERDVIKFMRQLLEGLVFIHDRSIVHLDIKPQNLVLMGEFPHCAVKLCDFEISRMLTPGHEVREILGTPDYVAPEILHYDPITTRTDMWSVGVLTYVLLTGFLPFGGENDQETFMEILKCDLDFPSELFEDITPEAKDFIKKLLIRQPEQRMSARESLNHSWIREENSREKRRKSSLDSASTFPASTSDSSAPAKQPVLSKTLSDSSAVKGDDPQTSLSRPPLHPSSSQKSLVGDTPLHPLHPTSTPMSTPSALSPFLYRQESKFGSRHNLDRLRSLSKSREVLSERVQMSNLKKSVSKSREKLGMAKCRDHLLALSSFHQSVEGLSTQQTIRTVYQSCNNLFVPTISLPQTSGNQERKYQSMAAIDRIGNVNSFYESKIKSEDNNDPIIRKSTDTNCLISGANLTRPSESKHPIGLKASTCRGGRGMDAYENQCKRHKQPDKKPSQKLTKGKKTEKMKISLQRMDKKEKEKPERLKKQISKPDREKKMSVEETKPNLDTPHRRRSTSHVEQRLQERHERNQERLLEGTQAKEEVRPQKRFSVDLYRSSSSEKPRRKSHSLTLIGQDRPRSIQSCRRKSKTDSPVSSDMSPSSSLESVEGSCQKMRKKIKVPDLLILAYAEKSDSGVSSGNEDPSVRNTPSPVSSEASSSGETEKKRRKETPSLSDKRRDSGPTMKVHQEHFQETLPNEPALLPSAENFAETLSKDAKELFIIKEESSSMESLKVSSVRRSVSNTSDLASQVSDSSEAFSSDKEDLSRSSPDWKSRSRSFSVFSSPSPPPVLFPKGRNRSNSFHFNAHESIMARPWGGVCSGSVARAFEKFGLPSGGKKSALLLSPSNERVPY